MVTVGIIATRFFKAWGIEPIFDVQGIAQNPTLYNASQLALPVMELFDKDETDEIYVFYTLYAGPDGRPVNAPHKARLLPIRLRDYEKVQATEELRDVIYNPSPRKYLTGWYPSSLYPGFSITWYSPMQLNIMPA